MWLYKILFDFYMIYYVIVYVIFYDLYTHHSDKVDEPRKQDGA